jgi:choline kinase
MKAIIIAAGMGSRLKHLTNDKPKCLLEFDGRPLFEVQTGTLRECGIDEIIAVKGYKQEKINFPGIKYYLNDNYQNNNILHSLFYAEEEMNDDLLISYSDIYYDKAVVERLLRSTADISIVVDIDWQGYYAGRTDHPIEEAENVIFDANNNVIEIGKIVTRKNDVHGEFIGMMKCSRRGAEILKKHFNRAKQLYWGKPFQRAKTFEKAYLTDMIQDMVELGVNINCVIIEKGWMEIDTIQDYEKVTGMLKGKED